MKFKTILCVKDVCVYTGGFFEERNSSVSLFELSKSTCVGTINELHQESLLEIRVRGYKVRMCLYMFATCSLSPITCSPMHSNKDKTNNIEQYC